MSAVNPVRIALVAALKMIPALAADDGDIVAHVYHEGEVRRGDPLPRIVIGSAFETPRGASRYGQLGYAGNEQIKCWGNDSMEAQDLYDAAEAVLSQWVAAGLSVQGFVLVTSLLERLTDYADPDPEVDAHVVVGRWTHEVRRVAA